MKKVIVSICAIATSFSIVAQSNEQYDKAHKMLKVEYKYKETLPLYQALLKSDSSNVNYLSDASVVYAKYGFYHAPEAEKVTYYKTAERLSKKAIALNEKIADSHYAYAMALGRINENASSKQKIANAKLIKTEADKAIALNPKHAGAYHILGRWHRTVAGFSSVEKMMINSFFGGVPEGGSYDDAVKAFMTAVTIEPKYIAHQYELAQTYYDMGKKADAKVWAEKAKTQTPVGDDDRKALKDLDVLLSKLK